MRPDVAGPEDDSSPTQSPDGTGISSRGGAARRRRTPPEPALTSNQRPPCRNRQANRETAAGDVDPEATLRRRRSGRGARRIVRSARVSGEGPGAHIGPYTLLQKIGEGGMGVVYLAEQVKPVRRQVALKIIRPGMDSDQVLGRFEAERQALA